MFKTCKKPPMSIISESGSICTFNALQSGLPLKSHTIALTATQSGSGDPSPVNVRTINGYNAINIWATGKNLWSFGDVSATRISLKNLHLPIGIYTLSAVATSTDTNYNVCGLIFEYNDGTNSPYYEIARNVRSSVQMTAEKPVRKIGLYAATNYVTSEGCDFTFTDIQIEIGNTASAYQPFGTYTTINLGGTYYFGEYDAVTGLFVATGAGVDLGTLNWNRYTTPNTNKTYFRTSSEISDCIKSTSVNLTYGLTCSNYVEGAWTNVLDASGYDLNFALGWSGKSYIAIYDNSKSEMTAADFKTAMNGVQLTYPLATPITIQLPPCPIDTLEGVNNIWADTGNTSLEAIKIGR